MHCSSGRHHESKDGKWRGQCPREPHRLLGKTDTWTWFCRQQGASTSSEQDIDKVQIFREYLSVSSRQDSVKKVRPEV